MKITLKYIAQEAGVSIRTVTRALNNQADISAKTRDKILQLVKENNYVPDVAARNLKKQASDIVGIILPDKYTEANLKKNFILQKTLEENGYSPLLSNLKTSPELQNSFLKKWAGIVTTIVFWDWNRDWNPKETMAQLPFKVIFIDCLKNNTNYPRITINRPGGISEGVDTLIKQGYKKIGYCGSHSKKRIIGYEKTLRDNTDYSGKSFIFHSGLEFEDGYRMGSKISQTVDAISFDTDRMALGFLRYARENGIKVPDDIAIIGFDNDDACKYSYPSLSSVAHPAEKIADKVVDIIRHNRFYGKQYRYSTKFIKRESV